MNKKDNQQDVDNPDARSAFVAEDCVQKLSSDGISKDAVDVVVKEVFGTLDLTTIYHRRYRIAKNIHARLLEMNVFPENWNPSDTASFIEESVSCYAHILHLRHGENPDDPTKKTNKGYAPRFEKVTRISGRTATSAKLPDLSGTDRPSKPWLNGLPCLFFISDMGDALSKDVSFEYLKTEIIDVAVSDLGRAHVWLWLTKRPKRMLEFYEWLRDQGIKWPENLIPMMSVIDQNMARGVEFLRQIPAALRGLSVEPLLEDVDIDLKGIDWVIVGGESGRGARPFDLAWARKLRDQCREAGVSFFLKQLGENPFENDKPYPKTADQHGGDWNEWPEDLRIREVPEGFKNVVVNREEDSKGARKIESPPTEEELSEFREQDDVVRKGTASFKEVGEALVKIRDKRLYRAGGYATWEAYCRSILGMSKTNANRQISSAAVARDLVTPEEAAKDPLCVPRSESQIRPLTSIKDPAVRKQIWKRARERSGESPPTAKDVSLAVSYVQGGGDPAKSKTSKERLLETMIGRIKQAASKSDLSEVNKLLDELEDWVLGISKPNKPTDDPTDDPKADPKTPSKSKRPTRSK